jgi:hypothetical protein
MRKIILPIVFIVLVSCNTRDNNSDAKKSVPDQKAAVTYPYPINYSSQFEMGDPEKSKIILDLWKDYDDNALDRGKDMFADTVTMWLADNEMHGSRDSILVSSKAYRNQFSSVSSRVDAVISTRSTDKNEDWVLVWGTETHTNKKNVTDSVHLQETWRLNKNGKIDFMMQYMRQPPEKINK